MFPHRGQVPRAQAAREKSDHAGGGHVLLEPTKSSETFDELGCWGFEFESGGSTTADDPFTQ